MQNIRNFERITFEQQSSRERETSYKINAPSPNGKVAQAKGTKMLLKSVRKKALKFRGTKGTEKEPDKLPKSQI